jgi:tetratricopeptide (TPR) repeat protein
MLQFDILGLIPQSLKRQALDTLVDFVSEQARKYAGEEIAAKIKKLRSDAAFNQAFEEGLRRAVRRFVQEYEVEDEDLVAAIAADEGFFKNEEVRAALLTILKKPGVYLAGERERLAEPFDSVLPGRKNRERVDRAVLYLLKCLAEDLWHLPELQPIYSLQFQRMTAEATRQQVELQKAQLQALTSLNAGMREALLQLTDAIAERKLLPGGETPTLPALPSRPKVYHNLPQPDYGRFVGREQELAQVVRILRPYPHSQHALVTIDGIGGIGKSALALEVAHRYLRNYERIPPEERFEAIIWASAKQTVLTAEGIVPRSQALRTLDDIYATVALRREDITRARPEEQSEVARNALTRQRTLLIVDNLETVDDEAVLTFLRELPAPTKAIVTTRHRIDVAYPVRLVGMPWEDAQALIGQECDKKGVALGEDEARRLYDRTGGVPLAIVWSIAQMGFGYGVKSVLARLGQPTSDIARFCFEGALERIRDKPAYNLLMALSLFATDASREALGCVAGLPELDRDEGLVELGKLSLLNKRMDRFSLLPLTHSYLAHESGRMPQFLQDVVPQMLLYYGQRAAPPPEVKMGNPYWDGLANYSKAESLEEESGNLVQVIRLALDQQYCALALDLFLAIVHFLHLWGLWDERLQLSREMCQVAHKLVDPAEVWLWIDAIGYILRQRQQFSECIQALNTGRSLATQFKLEDASILADVYEADLYAKRGDVELAQKKIEQALEQVGLDSLLERGTTIRHLVATRALGRAAALCRLKQDFIGQKELYELDLKLRLSTRENTTPTLSCLADVSLKLDDVASAEKYLVEASVRAGKKDWPWINYEWAVIAKKKGELGKARDLCTDALERFTGLGQESGIQGCRELLASLSS